MASDVGLGSFETNSLPSPFASLTPVYVSKTFLGHHPPFPLLLLNLPGSEQSPYLQ